MVKQFRFTKRGHIKKMIICKGKYHLKKKLFRSKRLLYITEHFSGCDQNVKYYEWDDKQKPFIHFHKSGILWDIKKAVLLTAWATVCWHQSQVGRPWIPNNILPMNCVCITKKFVLVYIDSTIEDFCIKTNKQILVMKK